MTATIPRFGALAPLLAPRSVAVVGASDREGNLGGLCVSYLRKFGYAGHVWPVNAGRSEVAGLACFPGLGALPGTPDLVVVAVPAESVTAVVRDCITHGVQAAIVWAGGFAEGDEQGHARQRELEDAVRGSGLLLCGPNCIGVINTSIGLTASFSSLMSELDRFNPGSVSIVSQSGGIAVTSHARAQELGLGFRLTISCGNEATLGIPAFVDALVDDDGTRVVCVYTEGMSDPRAFAAALARARDAGKPVVVLKGGATEAAGRAALAHTGRLAGADRAYDAIFRETAAIRVHSAEEMLDVALHMASLPPGRLPRGNRVLLSTFGGGSGVLGTDQCAREGLAVPPLGAGLRARVSPLVTPLASTMNPVDLTPGSITNPRNRETLPEALRLLCGSEDVDSLVFLSAGFGALAPAVAGMFEDLRSGTDKPCCISWLSPPAGIVESFAARGVRVFDEHARAIRATGHVARHAAGRRLRIRQRPELAMPFAWGDFAPAHRMATGVLSEDVAARILVAAGLPVARGGLAAGPGESVAIASDVGFPVAIKAISAQVTHRAAAGLVALDVDKPEAVARVDAAMRERAAALGAKLDGLWVQRMAPGRLELLVTAFRDAEFGTLVGIGMGGGATEQLDDVAFARAPLDEEGAFDLLGCLRTPRRLPGTMDDAQRRRAAAFLSFFSRLVASAPWPRFTFEVNPIKLDAHGCHAVDALVVVD